MVHVVWDLDCQWRIPGLSCLWRLCFLWPLINFLSVLWCKGDKLVSFEMMEFRWWIFCLRGWNGTGSLACVFVVELGRALSPKFSWLNWDGVSRLRFWGWIGAGSFACVFLEFWGILFLCICWAITPIEFSVFWTCAGSSWYCPHIRVIAVMDCFQLMILCRH